MNKEYTDGLRAIADWLDGHPEVEGMPEELDVTALNTKEEAAIVLKALRPCAKEYDETFFKITRKFGSIKLKFLFWRDAVCQRVVIGKKTVEAHLRPAQMIPAEVVEAHEEDVVEWRCGEALLDLVADEQKAAS